MAQTSRFSWQRAVRAVVFVSFTLAIAGLVYFGLRPKLTSAETSELSLSIPAISLETPVLEVFLDGKTLTAPDEIAGVYRAAENKDFIIGHSSTVFSNLKQIKIGDEIVFSGDRFIVQSISTQLKSDIDMEELLVPTTVPTIVLMTCYGERLEGDDFSHRLIVIAEKEGVAR